MAKKYFVEEPQSGIISSGIYAKNGNKYEEIVPDKNGKAVFKDKSSNVEFKALPEGVQQFILTSGADKIIVTSGEGYRIDALDGANTVTMNSGSIAEFLGGAGADKITMNNDAEIGSANLGNGKNVVTLNSAKNEIDNLKLGDGGNTITLKGGEITVLESGSGADKLTINAGVVKNAKLGDGKDTVVLKAGDSKVDTGYGDDVITVSGKNNTIIAGAGNDKITVDWKTAKNTVIGSSEDGKYIGNDIITIKNASFGNFKAVAGENDVMILEAKDGSGRITLNNWSAQKNTVYAFKDGKKSFDYIDNAVKGILQGSDKADKFTMDEKGSEYHGLKGNDTITVVGDNNTVYGDEGNDKITVNGKENKVYGGDGADTITVNGSDNIISGGAGNDKFIINWKTGNKVIINEKIGEVNQGKDTVIVNGIDFSKFKVSKDTNSSALVLTENNGGGSIVIDNWGDGIVDSITFGKDKKTRSYIEKLLTMGKGYADASDKADKIEISGEKLVIGKEVYPISQDVRYDDKFKFNLNSGAGNDTVKVSGKDSILVRTDSGDDKITVVDGNGHRIFGDAGKDTITVNGGNLHDIYGGDGVDTIVINAGDYVAVDGGLGVDKITVDFAKAKYASINEDSDKIGADKDILTIKGLKSAEADFAYVTDNGEEYIKVSRKGETNGNFIAIYNSEASVEKVVFSDKKTMTMSQIIENLNPQPEPEPTPQPVPKPVLKNPFVYEPGKSAEVDMSKYDGLDLEKLANTSLCYFANGDSLDVYIYDSTKDPEQYPHDTLTLKNFLKTGMDELQFTTGTTLVISGDVKGTINTGDYDQVAFAGGQFDIALNGVNADTVLNVSHYDFEMGENLAIGKNNNDLVLTLVNDTYWLTESYTGKEVGKVTLSGYYAAKPDLTVIGEWAVPFKLSVGTEGADTITLQHNNQNGVIYYGGAGDDKITVKSSMVYAYGDEGKDTIVVDSSEGGIIVDGGSGDDSITVKTADGDITAYGGAGNDTITINVGKTGDDYTDAYGGAGDDTIIINGGSRVEAYGGYGKDTYIVDWSKANSVYIDNTTDDTKNEDSLIVKGVASSAVSYNYSGEEDVLSLKHNDNWLTIAGWREHSLASIKFEADGKELTAAQINNSIEQIPDYSAAMLTIPEISIAGSQFNEEDNNSNEPRVFGAAN